MVRRRYPGDRFLRRRHYAVLRSFPGEVPLAGHLKKFGLTKDPPICFETTPALLAFRQTSGDANRLLNTLLVGLETLKVNSPIRPPDLGRTWHMPANQREWDDARNFALKMTMIAVIDGLDQYLRTLSRLPGLVPGSLDNMLNGRRAPGVDRRPTIPERLEALAAEYPHAAHKEHLATMHLLATWRNVFVHRDYRFGLPSPARKVLEGSAKFFKKAHSGSDLSGAISRFDQKQPPALKDLSLMIATAHRLVTGLDEYLLHVTDAKKYANALIRYLIATSGDARAFVEKVWHRGGDQAVGSIHALFLDNGGNHSSNRRQDAPILTRAEMRELFAFGRNRARDIFGIAE